VKISIDRLKEIIKEEIAGTNPENVSAQGQTGGDEKLDKFTQSATAAVKTILGRQQIKSGLEILAKELSRYQEDVNMKSKIVGLLLQQIGVTPDEMLRIANTLRTKD
tara:strand:+ start:64 stop:384 length:321 start_codon:yes stop_codon:yes gene_type:complete